MPAERDHTVRVVQVNRAAIAFVVAGLLVCVVALVVWYWRLVERSIMG